MLINNSLQTSAADIARNENEFEALLRKAVGAAAYLLDQHAISASICSAITRPVVERWMAEDFPDVIERLNASKSYESFTERVEKYLEALQSAAAWAEQLRKHGSHDVLAEDQMGRGIYSGLAPCIATGKTGPDDDDGLLTALLIDRFNQLGNGHEYSFQSVAPHTEIWLPDEAWGWCDIETAKATAGDVAYLLSREHFPPDMKSYTRERYALLIKVPAAVTPPALITPRHLDAVTISTAGIGRERSLRLASCPFLIPMVANEKVLSLFRNHLPVLYLYESGAVLVEHPWAPARDFTRLLHPHLEWDMPPEMDDEYCHAADFEAEHSDVMRVSEIRPMPLQVGPWIPWKRRFQLLNDDANIPF